MSEYISLDMYAKKMNIYKGDTIFVSNDTRKMMWDAMRNNANSDMNIFIDGLIEAVGEEGTVIFPTYNWDFCKGKEFDIRNTPCKTGILGKVALQRNDFYRTKHPIYSFAVHGYYADKLLAMNNKDSFGLDSPFAFLKEHNVINYIIDVSLKDCFTFVHFAEEHSGYVKHRYVKNFSASYIDEFGKKSNRTYSMFVRDLDLNVETTIDPIEEDFIKNGVEEKISINSSYIKRIEMAKAYDILLKDIIENKSRKLCRYKGQEERIC